jgi:hypothetical protein
MSEKPNASRTTKSEPPKRTLLPFNLSEADLSNLDALDADGLKSAIRSVIRSSGTTTESAEHRSHSNNRPGTPDHSNHYSHSNS